MRRSTFSPVAAFALALASSIACSAQEADLALGLRFGGDLPRLVGTLSAEAATISGAEAFRAYIDGEFSVDAEATEEIDVAGAAEATHATGPAVYGLKLEGAAYRFGETDSAPALGEAALSLSAPLTFNGKSVSFSLTPLAGIGFFQTEAARVGGEAVFSFTAGDAVLKPGLELSRVYRTDGSSFSRGGPSLVLSWYPGLPLSADAEAGLTLTGDETVSGGWTVPVSFSLVAVPYPWLTLSGEFDGVFSVEGAESVLIESKAEFSRALSPGNRLRFPVGISYRWARAEEPRFRATAAVGLSLY